MNLENFWITKKEVKRDFNDRIDDLEEIVEEEESLDKLIPRGLTSTDQISVISGVDLDYIYDWYSSAISRRGRSPIHRDSFVGHFEGMSSDPTFGFGDKERGFLLGYLKYGVFIPTHFAPRTLRGGYDLMQELGASQDIPAVLSITEDLRETLSKMPSWNNLDVSFLSAFRDDLVEKKIVYNSHPDVRNLMFGLVSDYLDEADKYNSD